MLLLKDYNIFAYELLGYGAREQKIARRYMNYVYKSINLYTTYSEFERIVDKANEKLYRKIFKPTIDKQMKL